MFGGVGKSAGWAAILGAVAVTLGASVSANAADLGGNCCADLEERIAELEATTARKGNRKVSVTISGWVNEAIFGWDDGTEQNVYIGTNSLEQSRFRFTGSAKIDKDWSAGYQLEVGLQGNPSSQWNQFTISSPSLLSTNQTNGLIVRKSNWFIKSNTLGQISVGLNGSATYHLLDDADLANTRNFADAEGPAVAMGGFFVRANGAFVGAAASPRKWSDVLRGYNNSTPGQAGRRDVVRYDSPTFQGFAVIAAWGEDDLWDAALTYKGEWNGIKVAARAGYGSSNDPGHTSVAATTGDGTACGGSQPGSAAPVGGALPAITDYNCTWEGAAATIMHAPSGIYLYGGWGRQHLESFNTNGVLTTVIDPNSTTWFIQPGIERKWSSLGKTTIFGQYQHDNAGSNPGSSVSADITFWQAGVVQNIEAAAMDLYAIYQHTDGSVLGNNATTFANGVTSLDAFQMITVGAMIQF